MRAVYSLYGLRAVSNLPIPGLEPLPDKGPIDVYLELGWLPSWTRRASSEGVQPFHTSVGHPDGETPPLCVWKVQGYFHLRYSDGDEFVVDELGTRVWASWTPDQTLESMTATLLGPVFGFILRLRGMVCLHGSTIAIANQAIA